MKTVLSTLFVSIALSAALHSADLWMTDFEAAKQKAAEGNKMLLMDFTGSDWCGWCIKLDDEVFSKPEFAEYAEENLVLLKLDFPRRKELSAEEQAQNQRLAEEYDIEGFPTVIVLNGVGEQIGTLGYMPGGPQTFIAALEELKK